MALPVVPGGKTESLPPIAARVLIGGKMTGYSGFAPGVFEEGLLMLQRGGPLYILGGFGGAAAELAKYFLEPTLPGGDGWLANPGEQTVRLNALAASTGVPNHVRTLPALLAELHARAQAARSGIAGGIAAALQTGLDDAKTKELMTSSDIDTVVRLLREGLEHVGVCMPGP